MRLTVLTVSWHRGWHSVSGSARPLALQARKPTGAHAPVRSGVLVSCISCRQDSGGDSFRGRYSARHAAAAAPGLVRAAAARCEGGACARATAPRALCARSAWGVTHGLLLTHLPPFLENNPCLAPMSSSFARSRLSVGRPRSHRAIRAGGRGRRRRRCGRNGGGGGRRRRGRAAAAALQLAGRRLVYGPAPVHLLRHPAAARGTRRLDFPPARRLGLPRRLAPAAPLARAATLPPGLCLRVRT
jgi:hypothetical protein